MITSIQFVLAWYETQRRKVLAEDSDRGDGIVQWVVITSVLVAAAIVIIAILVNKATDVANNTKLQ